jgi:hypothetical protein
MFVGAVPRQAVEQLTHVVPFGDWRQVFVGCSGSFRFDRAVKARYPAALVHSNDVSLLSCSLGALVTGAEFPIAFTGRLAFMECEFACNSDLGQNCTPKHSHGAGDGSPAISCLRCARRPPP